MRIEEFLKVNPDKFVLGLREGSAILIDSYNLKLCGKNTARLFKYGKSTIEISKAEDLNYLLS